MIDELFNELHSARYCSKLDLLSSCHQIWLRASDEHKMAFQTYDGQYEFIIMPFRLSNAPLTFHNLINDIFRSYLRVFVLVFFDDILIYSTDWDSYLGHLRLVLLLLREYHLVAKQSKCVFG